MKNYPKISFYPYFYYFKTTFLKINGPQKVYWIFTLPKTIQGFQAKVKYIVQAKTVKL